MTTERIPIYDDDPRVTDAKLYEPPERLRALLSRATDTANFDSTHTGQVLAQVVSLPEPEGRPRWYEAFMIISGLIDKSSILTEQRVSEFKGSPHEKTFTELRNTFAGMNLDAPWSAYRASLQHLVTIALPFVVHSSQANAEVAAIDANDLDEILAELKDVVEQVLSSELPTAFKLLLARRLNDLRYAILNYQIHGADGIAEAAAAVATTIVANGEAAKKSPATMSKVGDVIIRIEDIIIKTATIGLLLGPAVAKLLGSGG